MTDPNPPAEQPPADPPGLGGEAPPEVPEGASAALAGLNEDDAREVARLLATPGAVAWAQAQLADQEGTPATREGRYRVERNEAREQLAAATAQVERLQRAEVQRVAAAKLEHGADVFEIGRVELADLLTEDGTVDASKVEAATQALLRTRPGLGKGVGRTWPDFGQGVRGELGGPRSVGWADVLGGKPA
jgi:hypothetical protein